MNRIHRLVWSLVVTFMLNGIGVGQNKAAPAFSVRLPQEVKPETVRIDVDVIGRHPWRTRLAMRMGTYDYAVPFRQGDTAKAFQPGDAKFLKLLIYAPGYQTISREFPATELTAPRTFEVQFKTQRTTHLEGLLVDSARRPIVGETIALAFNSGCDNPDCILNPMTLSNATTGPDGIFQFEVPLLTDTDALFHQREFATYFALTDESGSLQPADASSQTGLAGGFTFAPQPAYATRMTVMRVVPGSIKGKLGPLSLKQNKLPSNLKRAVKPDGFSLEMRLKPSVTFGVTIWLMPDASFSQTAPAGTYDLMLHVVQESRTTNIPIADGIVIEESKTTTVQIP